MKASLKDFFQDPAAYPHLTDKISHIETHISDVFLTGKYAYKVKKPIKYSFVDFSSLEKRRYYCEREIKLNSRFAPEIYIEVVPVYKCGSSYSLTEGQEVAEYAVKMLQFDEKTLFTELLKRDELSDEMLVSLTRQIANFHEKAVRTPGFWAADVVKKHISENLDCMREYSPKILEEKLVSELGEKFKQVFSSRAALISSRQKSEVKALHGDLHLRNICLYKGEPRMFDGIEFNDTFACCDVWCDIAFLIMDLKYRGRSDLATLVVNTYLEETDDFEGLPLLSLYSAYRAAVRAKVNLYEIGSVEDKSQAEHACQSAVAHTLLALNELKERESCIIAVGGFSGTGKTTISRALSKEIGAIHVRSDAIRKHLVNMPLLEKAPISAYQPGFDDNVYLGMQQRASEALKNTGPVILDAVQRSDSRRKAVENFAKASGVRFVGIWCTVAKDEAVKRVSGRKRDASDATAEVVERQFNSLSSPESINWHRISTDRPLSEIITELRNIINL